jgi:hypothetical protein
MKSFSQFWEDVASDYEKGKAEYERSGAVKRTKQTQAAQREASQRSRGAGEYTRTQKEKTLGKLTDAEQRSQEVEAKTKELASQRVQQDQEAAQKAAKTAKATKMAIKGVIGAVKKVVKRK